MNSASVLRLATLIALTGLAFSVPAVAGDRSGADSDLGQVSVGGFLQVFETEVRLDSESLGQGTVIDLEDDLGLDDRKNSLRVDGFFRFGKRHRLDYGYVGWGRRKTRTLDQPVQFGEQIYDADIEVTSSFSTHVFKISYEYAVVRNDRIDLGLSFGLSVFGLRARLEGEGSVGQAAGDLDVQSNRAVAPVPLLGVRFGWNITPDVTLQTSGEVFDVSSGGLSGRLVDAKVVVDWFPWNHVGFGVGYNLVDLEFRDDDGADFEVGYRYSGALAYSVFRF